MKGKVEQIILQERHPHFDRGSHPQPIVAVQKAGEVLVEIREAMSQKRPVGH
jgi:hypothetical protein